MMDTLTLLAAAFFLPLFPLSLVFNALLARVQQPLLRACLMLVWPQIGLTILAAQGVPISDWVVPWAIFTAALYGLRLLTVREMGIWTGLLATSTWALLWLLVADRDLPWVTLSLSLPLVLLVFVAAALTRRFGAAYGGLAANQVTGLPRLASVLTLGLLAATATPLFPGFAVLLHLLLVATLAHALAILSIWLLWSWAGMRLLQGFLVGSPPEQPLADIGLPALWVWSLLLLALLGAGVLLMEGWV